MASIPIGVGKRKYIPDPQGTKYCTGCKEFRAIALFSPDKVSSDGLKHRCRACINARKRVVGRDRMKAKSWLKHYNLTPDGYQALFDTQQGVCAICGEPETRIHKGTLAKLSVDHDHATGAIRGLLCESCNHGLGRFKDDISRLERAIVYLRDWAGIKTE